MFRGTLFTMYGELAKEQRYMNENTAKYISLLSIPDFDPEFVPNSTTEKRVFSGHLWPSICPVEALRIAPTSRDISEHLTAAMTSPGSASGDPGSLTYRAESSSSHGGSPTTGKIGGELSNGGSYSLAVMHVIEFPLGS